MKHLGLIGLCLAALALSQGALAEKVYTWKDKNGVVHYGERPPKDAKATLVRTRTGHSDPTPEQVAAAQPKPEATQGSAAPASNKSLKDPERCAAARKNLEILNSVARIKMENAEGVTVYLTEEEKASQRTTTQLIIDQTCE